ncbi:AfsR/SARP family transcriptional regulator [Streptomyces sp. SL13]|uniref:AfsR/SARP family transcriptional regulator n=1 Tax=Streptantibioticus silvisoli TaxID=2705255 RepID=A0AA90KFA9_9ACTN|nr:AfsR/SARP family transcriptional regulator [Streptantibioticus silvisoli]MDI5963740.1 AfsR/SARP family transcriptional regulator [Streptantibioticus silvisoli]MDI5968699.1 AfsR/SARP family transcriptional regulator [Streptantibioticus silvisoli]
MEVTAGGRTTTPSAPKVRQVLAVLIARRNEHVSLSALATELWEGRPPRSATGTVQTYVYLLRKLLEPNGDPADNNGPLVTKAAGYLLRVGPGECDEAEFAELSARGQAALREGDPRTAAELLNAALALWTGPALADVIQGPLLQAHAMRLQERHMHTMELRVSAELSLGLHRELVGELKELACAHPLHEWFQGSLIIALQRCGRRDEALQVYQQLRTVLRDELGLDPSPGIQRIQQHVLEGKESTADLSLLPG